MLRDTQYLRKQFKLPEVEHRYGSNVHLLSDPFLFTTLARLCRPDCYQPLINQLLNTIYREMVTYVVNNEFPLRETTLETRMWTQHPEGKFTGLIIDPDIRVICVNLARAGTVPSQICFDSFNYILNPEGVRQDHIAINRKVDDHEKVVGTNLGGVKIGGDVKDAYVVVPDPMGATGSTLKTAMEIYRKLGPAKKYIAIHLVVTPEYLKAVNEECPELTVYAVRLDRGLSPAHCLEAIPGAHWAEEKGLNSKQYIVPGAGGLGEVINNSYV